MALHVPDVVQFFRKTAASTRDQAMLTNAGSEPPKIRKPVENLTPYPAKHVDVADAAHGIPSMYIPIQVEMYKSYVVNPTNQGQRAAIAQRQTMMFQPRNNPARMQFVQAYTDPIQSLIGTNTWDDPSGLSSKGRPTRQPSTKAASPFANLPIPVRMPWDL